MRIESAVVMSVMLVMPVMLVAMAFGSLAFFVVTVTNVIVPVIAIENDRIDPRRGYHADTAEFRRLDQPVQPALEVQPIEHEDVRLAHRTGGGRGRPVDVRIPVRPDKRGDGHVLAADTRHHVAEYREGGDHPNRFVGFGQSRGEDRQGSHRGGGIQQDSARNHEREPSIRLRVGVARRRVRQGCPPARERPIFRRRARPQG